MTQIPFHRAIADGLEIDEHRFHERRATGIPARRTPSTAGDGASLVPNGLTLNRAWAPSWMSTRSEVGRIGISSKGPREHHLDTEASRTVASWKALPRHENAHPSHAS